ncbi:hypothetical protein M0812_18191 [Anaeramoeba flamelloides]|uniref:Tyrosine-protein kinase ephrin type A/B receptor-like domain-containing protein n=1 Tax=Anaeramoeba flamelloides TaxID=1746091 RepID=A0AAV7Z2U4_9EUKA|nr:hypothetical protein M0812_18191 [Anaeramoeba flamelloides]
MLFRFLHSSFFSICFFLSNKPNKKQKNQKPKTQKNKKKNLLFHRIYKPHPKISAQLFDSQPTIQLIENLKDPLNCSKGQYLNPSDQCKSCSNGTSTEAEGSVGIESCLPCDKGTYSISGWSSCKQCQPGTYGNSEGLSECFRCVEGTYNPLTGSTDSSACIKCPDGMYSETEGASDNSTCTECPAGTYNSKEGASSLDLCLPCQIGTYSQTVGANSVSFCLPCENGYEATDEGSSSCEPCPPGTYQNDQIISCTPCASGSYSNESSTVDCTLCPSGYLTNEITDGSKIGSVGCFKCDDEMLCLGGYKCAFDRSPYYNCTGKKKNNNNKNNNNNNDHKNKIYKNKRNNYGNNNNNNNNNNDKNNNDQNSNSTQNNFTKANDTPKEKKNNKIPIWLFKKQNPQLLILLNFSQLTAIVVMIPIFAYSDMFNGLRKAFCLTLLDVMYIIPPECFPNSSFFLYWDTVISLPIVIFFTLIFIDLIVYYYERYKIKNKIKLKFNYLNSFYLKIFSFLIIPIILSFILILCFDYKNDLDVWQFNFNSRIEITNEMWREKKLSFIIFGIFYLLLILALFFCIIYYSIIETKDLKTISLKKKKTNNANNDIENTNDDNDNVNDNDNDRVFQDNGINKDLNLEIIIEKDLTDCDKESKQKTKNNNNGNSDDSDDEDYDGGDGDNQNTENDRNNEIELEDKINIGNVDSIKNKFENRNYQIMKKLIQPLIYRFKSNKAWVYVLEKIFNILILLLLVLYPALEQRTIGILSFIILLFYALSYLYFKPHISNSEDKLCLGNSIILLPTSCLTIPVVGVYLSMFCFFIGPLLCFLALEQNYKFWSNYSLDFENSEIDNKILTPHAKKKILIKQTRNQKRKLWELREQLKERKMEIRALNEEFAEFSNDNSDDSQFFESSSQMLENDYKGNIKEIFESNSNSETSDFDQNEITIFSD